MRKALWKNVFGSPAQIPLSELTNSLISEYAYRTNLARMDKAGEVVSNTSFGKNNMETLEVTKVALTTAKKIVVVLEGLLTA